MKYLLLPLLLLLYACQKDCEDIELVDLEVAVNHDLMGTRLSIQDTLNLTIDFPEELLNQHTGKPYNLSTATELIFALSLRSYPFDLRGSRYSFNSYPSAKEDFSYTILEGEEADISVSYGGLGFSQSDASIFIRPQYRAGRYSLQVALSSTNILGSSPYLLYWNIVNNNEAIPSEQKYKELKANPCQDLIVFGINNPGTSNLFYSDRDSLIENRERWVSDQGLLFFDISL